MRKKETIEQVTERLGFTTDYIEPYTVVENYIFDIQGLSPTKKLFLLLVRKYVGSSRRTIQYGYARIMKDLGIASKNTVSKCIKFFEWLEILEKYNSVNPSGEYGTNTYCLNITKIEEVVEHFKINKYKWKDVEKYFELQYKISNDFASTEPCKYLK